jgi:hypothetical protein
MRFLPGGGVRSTALVASCAILSACGGALFLLAGEAQDAAAAAKAAEKSFREALASKDIDEVDRAAAEVARVGGAALMKRLLDLLEKIPPSEDALYWSVIGGVVSFGDRPAETELGKFLVRDKTKALARDILYGLAKNGSPHAVLAVRQCAMEGPEEVRVLAATKLSRIRSKEAVDALIELLKVEEKASPGKPTQLSWIAVEGLSAITRQKLSASSVNWEGWWQVNRKKPLPAGNEAEATIASPTGTAVDVLKMSPDRIRRQAFVGVEQAPLKSVVVLSAEYKRLKLPDPDLNFDHMERVLDRMHIPHTVVHREDFTKFDLSETGVLLINCAQFHEHCICPTCKPSGGTVDRLRTCSDCNVHRKFSAHLTGAQVEKIKDFVQKGGYLFCEDWTIREVVQAAFPKYVTAGRRKLVKAVVDVIPARGMGTHPYLAGIFEPKFVEPWLTFGGSAGEVADSGKEEKGEGTTVVAVPTDEPGVVVAKEEAAPAKVKHQWVIDDESSPIKIADNSRVLTLLTSGKLQKQSDGDGGAVAAAFRPGSNVPVAQKGALKGTPGVVMAVLSHFGKQDSVEDEFSIQNVLLNFLIDANAAREERASFSTRKSKEGKDTEKEKAKDKDDKG